jgi:dipeptidyl aminopeptidase/acylaminoacyl peptidase
MRKALFSVLLVTLLPSIALGATPAFRYGTVQVQGENSISISYSTLEHKEEYGCTLTPLACGPLTSNMPISGLPELPYGLNPAGTLALVSEAGEGGRYSHTLYRISAGSAELQQVLPFYERISSLRWSANGERLSFISPVSRTAVLVDIPLNTVMQIVPLPGVSVSFSTLSSTGRYLALYAFGTTDSPVRRHYLIDLQTGTTYATKQEKLAYWDLLTEENRLYAFSPNDKYLAYLDYRDGYQKPWIVDLAKLKGPVFRGEALSARKYTVGDFIFTDNDRLLFSANRTAPLVWDLWSYAISTGVLTKAASSVAYYPPFKKAGDHVFYNELTPRGSEVLAYNVRTRQVQSLPLALPQTMNQISKGQNVKYGTVSGVLLKPDDYSSKKAYPLVVWLHGGPHRQTSTGYHPYASYGSYDWILDEMRRNGAVVLKLDYTGSYGYGRAFAEALRGNVGKKDVADVLAGVTGVKRSVKTSAVYLMGTSYGAYLALRSQVAYPATYAGVISVNGVTDWQSLIERDAASIFRTHFNGSPKASNQRSYDQASILDRIDRITTQKIILTHGTDDHSVPNWQSGLLNEMLLTIQKNVQFKEYVGEDHVYAKAENVEDLCRRAGELVLGFAPACDL